MEKIFKIKASHPTLRRIDIIGDEASIVELQKLGYAVGVTPRNLNDRMKKNEALELVKFSIKKLRNIIEKLRTKEYDKEYEKIWMNKLQSYIHVESYLYHTSES